MTGCPSAPPVDTENPQVRDACTKRVYLMGGDNFRLLVSIDEGKTWQTVQPVNIDGDDYVNDIVVARGIVTMIGLPGLYASTDGAKTFTAAPNISRPGTFDSYGGEIVFGAGNFFMTDQSGTYTSTDGQTWKSVTPFPDNSFPNEFGKHFHGRAYGNQIYVLLQDGGAVRTFNGTTWWQGALGDSSVTRTSWRLAMESSWWRATPARVRSPPPAPMGGPGRCRRRTARMPT